MRAVYPRLHTLVKSMLTISCTTASVERYLSRSRCYHKYTWDIISLRRRTTEFQLLWWFYIVM